MQLLGFTTFVKSLWNYLFTFWTTPRKKIKKNAKICFTKIALSHVIFLAPLDWPISRSSRNAVALRCCQLRNKPNNNNASANDYNNNANDYNSSSSNDGSVNWKSGKLMVSIFVVAGLPFAAVEPETFFGGSSARQKSISTENLSNFCQNFAFVRQIEANKKTKRQIYKQGTWTSIYIITTLCVIQDIR